MPHPGSAFLISDASVTLARQSRCAVGNIELDFAGICVAPFSFSDSVGVPLDGVARICCRTLCIRMP
eukprot:5976721-Pyramimonas_sp.AAC.1